MSSAKNKCNLFLAIFGFSFVEDELKHQTNTRPQSISSADMASYGQKARVYATRDVPVILGAALLLFVLPVCC